MTALTQWYDDVLLGMKGLGPGNAALKLIRDAAIEFCERSLAWVIDHPAVSTVAGTSTYTFAPGTGMNVVAPVNVMVNGASIDPANDGDLDANYGDDWRNGVLAQGPAEAYRMPTDTTIQIVPTPSTSITGGLVMRVAVKPTIDATSVDDMLYRVMSYRDAIKHGARYRAFLTQGAPFSDAAAGAYALSEFNRLVMGASLRQAKGNTRLPLRASVVHTIR